MSPIITEKNKLKFAVEFLGTPEALVWVGHGFDPADNDDERVRQTRELMAKYYAHIPYGMSVGNRAEDGVTSPMRDEDGDGYYELDVSWWPEGVYRLNYHSLPGEASAVGTPLNPSRRDWDVSWPQWWKDWDETARAAARPFMHLEKNGAGSCFRILIRPDRTIEPFGDLGFSL